ncbi:radical SAM family heme chaperone HemW [Mariniblastus fucicola]|uniref:Heme chaperone HemW n=1 Tax=Mariniblastus fucicola TaxID=980251 RepID=A0A5B9P518_9BACT|nr:radical SAM family heme chaperone HemW [Mariniblastus fucicola]QEG21374.1 Oxygen-independent coproporphyrinogen-III oxidase-like protein [Mariniblastus fucicola]
MSQPSSPYFPADAAPRSVYVHVPFCRHRCGYCNFALVAGRDHLIDPFLDALESEIESISGTFEIDTLFFGGGTPSHLSASQLARLGEILFAKFRLSEKAEVSAECNPSDITDQMLVSLQAIGVNRISLGVQSFDSAKLKVLQRDHDADIARRAFELAMERTGNVSMDLIFAAPDETQSQWEEDLETALSLDPVHLSTYELTWEKGTTFWNRKTKGELDGSSEDLRVEMYQAAIDRIGQAGLEQYEVSSFAKPGKRCQHNLQYWLCNPWFAFGPSAASFVGGVRNTNHRSPMTWMKRVTDRQSPVQESEPLSDRDRAIERLIFGLRMVDGIAVNYFEDAIGSSLESLSGDVIAGQISRGLVQRTATHLRLTPAGRMVADSVAVELL